MAVEFQACSNIGSWDCCTSDDNARMHGYMQIFRVLAVYVQMSYTDFAKRVTAQLRLSNQFSPAQLVVSLATVNAFWLSIRRLHGRLHQKTASEASEDCMETASEDCMETASEDSIRRLHGRLHQKTASEDCIRRLQKQKTAQQSSASSSTGNNVHSEAQQRDTSIVA